MPQNRLYRLLKQSAALAAMALLATTLTVVVAAPSQAATNPATSVTKLFDAIPTYSAPASTTPWFDKTFNVSYPGAGPAYLSSDTSGYYVMNPFDRLQVFVGGTLVADQEFWEDNCTQTVSIMYNSLEISQFLKAGNNQLTLKFLNKCPTRGSDAGYLVIGPPGTHDPYDPPVNCNVKFFGVRGSGETASDAFGFGSTMGAMSTDLYLARPDIQSEAIGYPAIAISIFDYKYSSNYVNSVSTGVDALKGALRYFFNNCPHSYALIGGYSQGAEVVDKAYAQLTDNERKHIASVTNFGDPSFNPAQTAIDRGDYLRTLSGINKTVLGDKPFRVAKAWEARNRSYCTSGDPVCNFSLGNASIQCTFPTLLAECPHLQYPTRGWVDKAAIWAVANLASLPPL